MSAIGIAYNSFNLLFDTFSGAEVARTYDSSVSFERGLSGQQVIGGRPGRQKFIWAISAVVNADDAKILDDIFKAWDTSRAAGNAAAVGVTDQTLFDPVTTDAVFTTPPSYIRMNAYTYTVAFGLTEV
ncbi:MAG: hypothetical protein CL959_01490 [Euryarchaeota archaeon]|nr:hypothetical protein [Euryarchaeota archaeon]|tara:strand:- start:156 stop:539 length:384 start_codon:yes stop_codon:yes gene_type:complete